MTSPGRQEPNRPGRHTPRIIPETARWAITAHQCPKHAKPLYMKQALKGGRVLRIACPDCPNGPNSPGDEPHEINGQFA